MERIVLVMYGYVWIQMGSSRDSSILFHPLKGCLENVYQQGNIQTWLRK